MDDLDNLIRSGRISSTSAIYIMQMGISVGTHVGLDGLSMFFVEKAHEDFGQHMKEKFKGRIRK